MSSTIQWCDGPSPSVNRPSHTAWVDSACCAMATGWRVWIGITAVPELDARGRPAHERDRGERVEVVGDLRHPDRGEAGLPRRPRRRRRAAPPSRGSGPARDRSSGRSASAVPPHGPSRRPAATVARGNPILDLESQPCTRVRAASILAAAHDEPRGSAMSRVAVVTGAASGMGLAIGRAPRGATGTGSRCSTSTATPPSARPTDLRARARRRSRRRSTSPTAAAVDAALDEVRNELGPGRDHGDERRPRPVRAVHRDHRRRCGIA